jgi:hypothetical protein
MKLYAYIIYSARRAMVAVGNGKFETWFAFVLVSWIEVFVLIYFVYLAIVFWKLNLANDEVPIDLALVIFVGLANYLLVYRGGIYKHYDDEFAGYSASKHAVRMSAAAILAVAVIFATGYLPSVFR